MGDVIKPKLAERSEMAGATIRERLAVALIMSPTILFCIPIWGALNHPSLLIEHWDFYLLFLGIPYAVALALWLGARHSRRSA
jgi:hypothetical protein